MKLSFLLYTIHPRMAYRMIESVRRGGVEDYEIVVCCPEEIKGDRIVWTEDFHQCGSDPAMRQCFHYSSGEIVCSAPDDHLVAENGLRLALEEFSSSPEDLWDMKSDWTPMIFGRLFAAYPMCRRSLVEKCIRSFYPYTHHFGDPAFGLGVWRSGASVRQTSRRIILFPQHDRMGYPESPGKLSGANYEYGKRRIFEDFPEFSQGWDPNNRSFNQ